MKIALFSHFFHLSLIVFLLTHLTRCEILSGFARLMCGKALPFRTSGGTAAKFIKLRKMGY
jgi:hypothetical protein